MNNKCWDKREVWVYLVLALVFLGSSSILLNWEGITGASIGVGVVGSESLVNEELLKANSKESGENSIVSSNEPIISNEDKTTSPAEENKDLGIQAVCGGATDCACGDSVTSSWTMNHSLNCSGLTALTLDANHVTLDCNGSMLYYNGTPGSGTGISIGGYRDNVTVKNCQINNFTTGLSTGAEVANLTIQNNTFIYNTWGVILIEANSTQVINNTFSSGNYGVELDILVYNTSIVNNTLINHSLRSIFVDGSGADNNISNNSIYNNTVGIFIEDTSNTYITTNNIYDNLDQGVYVWSTGTTTTDNWIQENTFYLNGINSASTSGGVVLEDNADQTIVANNQFFNNTNGISSATVDNNFSSNTIYENTQAGISISGNRNKIYENNFTNNPIGVEVASNSNNITNNEISQSSSYGVSLNPGSSNRIIQNNITGNSYGIYVSGSTSNTFSLNKVKNSTSYALYLTSSSLSNSFSNNFYSSNTLGIDLTGSAHHTSFTNEIISDNFGIEDSGGTNITLLNSSFGTLSVVGSSSELLVKWYAQVHINNTENEDLTNVNVTVYNSTSGVEQSALTDATGLLTFELVEYTKTSAQTEYQTPHILNATLQNINNETEINLTQTNSTDINLVLDVDLVECGYVNSDLNFTHNFQVNGSCFIINASGITLDGKGTMITGNGSGHGINITTFDDVTIIDVNFQNFSQGLYLENSSNNTISNSYFENHTTGIYLFDNSDENNFSSNYIQNNVENGTALESSNFNLFYNNYFSNNTNNSWDNGDNDWNVSKYSGTNIIGGSYIGGNYWGDYTGADANLDGVGEAAYSILGGSSQDNYPLKIVTAGSCKTINITTILPPQTITTESTCFTINAANIILDGNGATIQGDGGSSDIGILINGYDNVTIKNLTIIQFGYGMDLNGVNYTLQDNNLTNNTWGIEGTVDHSTIVNNTIDGLGVVFNQYGFRLTGSDNNMFVGNSISGNQYGTYLINSKGNQFEQNTFNATEYDLYATSTSSANLTNQSFDKSKMFSDVDNYIYVRWYAQVNVSNTTGSPIATAQIETDNVQRVTDNLTFTNTDGLATISLTEYYLKNNVTYYTTNNHTIRVSKDGYTNNYTYLDLINSTGKSFLNLTLADLYCGMTLNDNASLGSNLGGSSDCLTVGADGITIDGNGYNLTGGGTGTGINFNDKAGIKVSHLQISNFTYGISLQETNTSNLYGLTIINNTYGIFFNTSNANNIYNGVIENNSVLDINATNKGGTNNSLVNTTIDINNVSISGTAVIYLKWYVDVNATFGEEGYMLQGANATGFFNNSPFKDFSKSTDNAGFARLELAELKKNASGVYYLTPHNISVTYTSSSETVTNETSINLSTTNNTQVNLILNLNCTVPTDNLEITTNTNFCPGTYDIRETCTSGYLEGFCMDTPGSISVMAHNVDLTCDSTIINVDFGEGIFIDGYDNVSIAGCDVRSDNNGFVLRNSDNFTLSGVSGGAYLKTATNGLINDFTGSVSLYSSSDNNLIKQGNGNLIVSNSDNNNFTLVTGGINMGDSSATNLFTNNTITGGAYIEIDAGTNNQFYHNTFSDNSWHISNLADTSTLFNTTLNVSGNFVGQGNQYDDYCDKGSDTNGDGYADNESSAGAGDYPYNATTSGKFSGIGADWAPKIITCPSEVQLGGGGGGGSSSPPVVELPISTPAASKPSSGSSTKKTRVEPKVDYYNVDETKKFLKVEKKDTLFEKKIIKVKVSLENKGNKKMSLFPQLSQEAPESFFIVTKKTLGFEGSFFSRLAGISYSKDKIAERLLKAEILNPEQIILEPGQKLEKILEVKEGLVIPRQIKVQFATLGEVVKEQEIKVKQKKALSGTAIDIDYQQNKIDVYSLIVPDELIEELEKHYASQLTGAAVTDVQVSDNDYFLELSINQRGKKKMKRLGPAKFLVSSLINLLSFEKAYFSDLYGPYTLDKNQTFIFAQQFKYNPKIYSGDYLMKTKIYKRDKILVTNEFNIKLGEGK